MASDWLRFEPIISKVYFENGPEEMVAADWLCDWRLFIWACSWFDFWSKSSIFEVISTGSKLATGLEPSGHWLLGFRFFRIFFGAEYSFCWLVGDWSDRFFLREDEFDLDLRAEFDLDLLTEFDLDPDRDEDLDLRKVSNIWQLRNNHYVIITQ